MTEPTEPDEPPRPTPPAEPEPPSGAQTTPPEPAPATGGESMAQRMHRIRTGSDEQTVRPERAERAGPTTRAPRIARKEPGRRVRERAAREERARPPAVRPEPAEPVRPEAVSGGQGEVPDQGEPAGVVQRLAGRLAAMRGARGWSLEDLARRSGVSRSTLSRVERGQISPTAAVLVRLAGAYDHTLSGLLAEVEAQPRSLVRAAEQTVTGEDTWRRRVVSPPFPGLRGSVVDAQLQPGTDVVYEPPVAGAEQHLWLITGSLEVSIGAEKLERSSHADVPHGDESGATEPPEGGDFVLIRGDCLRLRLWGPTRLRCLSPDPARYALVTVAP